MKRASVLILAFLVLLIAVAPAALAKAPPRIPAWFDGEIVHFTVTNENAEGADHRGVHQSAEAILYAFGEPGDQPQFDVLDSVPGHSNYNPWWHVIVVIPLDGRDLGANPYTSEAEILTAEQAGLVLLIDIEFHFLCQVLP